MGRCVSVSAMRRRLQFARHGIAYRPAILLVLALTLVAFAATAGQRVYSTAKFVPGEMLRYRIDMRMTTTGKTTTPIANPEGASKLSQNISLLVRLDVLDPPSDAVASADQTRFRATYEKSQAQSESDALDPDEPSLSHQYARLEGQSIEFTLEPNGQLADLKGLEDIFLNRSESDPMLSWLQGISAGNRFPRNGIAIGQKWSDEHPLEGLPLSDVIWRTESTYMRNEPCSSSVPSSASRQSSEGKGSSEECAVILTSFDISRRGSPQSDATPQDYLRDGLRTSGSWTGSGESLDSFSLTTGLLRNSTQTSTQDVDYEIKSASTGSRIHRVSKVQTQSEISLVSEPSPGP
ncbi:MAG: hypothetical protein ACRD4C_07090 [Candidatus Acidiferrales bacterium]